MKILEVDDLLQNISAALQRFAASPRYNMLKTLQIGRVMPEAEEIGVLNEFTFEKLVELGTERFISVGLDDALTLSRLLSLLYELAGTNQTLPEASQLSSEDSEEPIVSSIAAENRMREVVQQLKAHSGFGAIANKPLRTFWEENWLRAPFEESMSFEQFVRFDLTMLLKKKSMSAKRISVITKALERAYTTLSVNDDIETRMVVEAVANPIQSTWAIPRQSLSAAPIEGAVFYSLASFAALPGNQEISVFLREILELHSPGEIWQCATRVAKSKLRITCEQILRKTAPTVHAVATASLAGTGASLKRLEPLITGGAPPVLRSLLTALIVGCFDVAPVVIGKRPIEDSWTTTPEASKQILKVLLGAKPSKLRTMAADLCPFLDPAAVLAAMSPDSSKRPAKSS